MGTENKLQIFCKNIAYLRKINRLSKKEMAKRLGIGVRRLSLLERGTMPLSLGCNVLFNIQEHFGITPSDMFAPLYEDRTRQ